MSVAAITHGAVHAIDQPLEHVHQLSEMDFDVTRMFSLLMAMTILPMFLGLSVVSYSLGVLL